MKINDITFKRLSNDNFILFYNLFKNVFGSKLSYNQLLLKYCPNHIAQDLHFLGYMAIHENKAVSYCGSIIANFMIDEVETLGAHSCDHMTRSSYRGNGLFAKLNEMMETLLIDRNISFVYGFPNQNNAPILIGKAGWMVKNQMLVYEFNVVTFPLRKLLNRFLKRFKNIFISSDDYPHVLNEQNNTIIRNQGNFDYKKSTGAGTKKINNILIWFKNNGDLFIGDIFPKQAILDIDYINDIKRFAFLSGFSKMVFIVSTNHKLNDLLKNNYKSIKGNVVGFKQLIGDIEISFESISFTYADYDTF